MPRSLHNHERHSPSPVNHLRHVSELGRVVPKPDLKDRDEFSPAIRYSELDRFPQERTVYSFDRHRYHLRQSEIYTMAEAGKFRAVSLEDLQFSVYAGDRGMMCRDL